MNKMLKIKFLFILVIYILYYPIAIFANSVHVLMPVYNAAEYLNKSIPSVFNQSFGDMLLIVYNDGSTDRTNTVLNELYNKQLKKMIIFESKENKGVSFARTLLLNKSFEIDPDAYILWLDSDDRYIDDTFIEKFHAQMKKTNADICLFNVSLVLEDVDQQNNSKNVSQELKRHEEVLDHIYNAKNQCLSPDLIDNILNISCLGHTKGYKKINWPKPIEGYPYEDFVYMASLLKASSITSLPSNYKPIEYLRRSNSLTGKKNEKSFQAIHIQLEQFIKETPFEKRQLHKDKIYNFVVQKTSRYENVLIELIGSKDHPDLTESTLNEYRINVFKLLNSTLGLF